MAAELEQTGSPHRPYDTVGFQRLPDTTGPTKTKKAFQGISPEGLELT
jgi:hypothetical protein